MAKSVLPSMPKLSEAARHLVFPELDGSLFPRVQQKLADVGVRFDPWQNGFGTISLGLDCNGKFASTIGGVCASIPRQVGKTFTIGHLIIGLCLLIPNLRVIWTSHHLVTTGNTFQSMQGMVKRPKVMRFVDEIRLANGEQRIAFKNGSVVMFGARSHGFGLGMDAIDVVVFDEAQRLTARGAEDLVPTTNQARNPYGALLFFIGTPPRPADDGDAFKSKRRQALSGAARNMVYVEFSADADAKLDDRAQWPKMNPSYPFRTPLESMLRMRENMADDAAWRREAMGIWDSDNPGTRLISKEIWERQGRNARQVEALRESEETRTFGVTFSLDGKRVAVAGGMKHADGAHAEVVDGFSGHMAEGLDALAAWLAEESRRSKTAVYAISGRSHAEVLSRKLIELGVPRKAVHILNSPEYFAACSMYETGLRDKSVTHSVDESANQELLDRSVAVCDKKLRGTAGSWSWDVTVPGGDETPVEAVSVAVWAALTTKRKPGRKVRAVVLG